MKGFLFFLLFPQMTLRGISAGQVLRGGRNMVVWTRVKT
jgi:hypothetical protein